MAKAFAHVPVPKFSANQLALAEVCAVELWNGFDYQTAKEFDVSDEDLLVMFSTPTFAMYKSARTRQQLTELDLRELIRVARLNALQRKCVFSHVRKLPSLTLINYLPMAYSLTKPC